MCRLVPPSSIEVRGDTYQGDIITGMVDLLDLGLELVVAVVVARVLGMEVQAQGPVHALTMVEYIKALVTYHQEHVSNVVRLGTLLDYARIMVISRHIHRVHLLQLLSQHIKVLTFMHQGILSRVVLSIWASRAVVQEVDLERDLVAEDLCNHLLHSRQAMDRLEF